MAPEGERIAVEAVIHGRVQGVFYRGWTEEEAARRGLCGWVRNNADGTVSAVFAGQRKAVDEMLAACWKGPLAARVDRIETRAADPEGAGQEFSVLR